MSFCVHRKYTTSIRNFDDVNFFSRMGAADPLADPGSRFPFPPLTMDIQPHAPSRRPAQRKKPGRPPAGTTLTPRAITAAATRLIQTEGEAAFTMRRLGDTLGVKAMALYNHFADKDAILDAVALATLTELPVPPAKGPWQARIRAISHSLRALARAHPPLYRVAVSRPLPPTTALPLIEAVLSALAEAGLPVAAQAVAYNTLRLYVQAFCLHEIEQAERQVDLAALARTAAPYPRTTAALHQLFAGDADREFEAGLELLLRGLQRR